MENSAAAKTEAETLAADLAVTASSSSSSCSCSRGSSSSSSSASYCATVVPAPEDASPNPSSITTSDDDDSDADIFSSNIMTNRVQTLQKKKVRVMNYLPYNAHTHDFFRDMHYATPQAI